MNLIKDKNELALEFPKLTVYRPKFYSLKYNDNVTYECGCNNSHRLNDDTILVFSMARPGVNFLFLCPKGFYSMVSVKGFFKTSAKTLWTCKKKFFIDYMDAIGMAESIPDPRFK